MESKVRIFCVYKGAYPYGGMAMTYRLRLYGKGLTQLGHQFIVAAEKGKASSLSKEDLINQRVIHWRKNYLFDKIYFIRDLFSPILRIYLYYTLFKERKNYDNLFSCGYKWPQLIFFIVISRLLGKKFVIELNELPHSVIASRLQTPLTNKIHRKILFHLIFPFIDGFIVISENLINIVKEFKVPSAQFVKIPILIDDENLKNVQIYNRFEAPFIFHAGTLTEEKDGILEVFEAFAMVTTTAYPNLRLILSNYMTLPKVKERIHRIIETYGVKEKVKFYSHLNEIDLFENYKKCSMVIINKPNNFRNKYNFSTKLGECMNFAIPIITTDVGDSSMYLKDKQNVLVINNSYSAKEIANHICTILDNPKQSEQLGINAFTTAQDSFNYRLHSEKLSKFFQNL